jgi:putative ABC transport system permease protein
MEPKMVREGRATVIKVRNINRDIYLPITTALRRFPRTGQPDGIEEIAIRVARPEDLTVTARLLKERLEQQHRGVEDYEILVPEELLAQAQRTQQIFNIIMGSIAGISLLVGGIGIMNIMLANVSERTREIGIRRAIGATKGDILVQFIIETVLICLTGGVLGNLVGFGLARTITLYAKWETGFSMSSILIAFGTSASIGLLFGLFPARRAAQLDPVQALRSE